jgi:hypothetical protein
MNEALREPSERAMAKVIPINSARHETETYDSYVLRLLDAIREREEQIHFLVIVNRDLSESVRANSEDCDRRIAHQKYRFERLMIHGVFLATLLCILAFAAGGLFFSAQ